MGKDIYQVFIDFANKYNLLLNNIVYVSLHYWSLKGKNNDFNALCNNNNNNNNDFSKCIWFLYDSSTSILWENLKCEWYNGHYF